MLSLGCIDILLVMGKILGDTVKKRAGVESVGTSVEMIDWSDLVDDGELPESDV